MTADNKEIANRMDALEDTQATQEEKIEAHSAQLATINKVLPALLQQYARSTGVPLVDEQQAMINARANERAAQLTPPVRFGSSTPYDGQSDRIDGKRREALGK
jgi:uncharacterized coiled-coil protein SlyX